jgi:hypothetical protein
VWEGREATDYEALDKVFFRFQYSVPNEQQMFNVIAVTLLCTAFYT